RYDEGHPLQIPELYDGGPAQVKSQILRLKLPAPSARAVLYCHTTLRRIMAKVRALQRARASGTSTSRFRIISTLARRSLSPEVLLYLEGLEKRVDNLELNTVYWRNAAYLYKHNA